MKPAVRRDPKPANDEQPRAIATIRRVDDPDRLAALLAILNAALDERAKSGGQG